MYPVSIFLHLSPFFCHVLGLAVFGDLINIYVCEAK